MNLSTLRLAGDDLAEKVDKLGAGMPRAVFPRTSPVRVFSAAYSESVP